MKDIMVKPRLNEILKERGMTQNDLAQLTGITQPVISRFDKNTQHRSIHLYLISRALDIKIDELFTVVDTKSNNSQKKNDSNN